MTDFTRDWIAKREKLEGLLSAHDSLVDTCGDLTAAVAVGQLHVSDLLAEARADARTSLPAALAALKAALELHRLNREDDGACQGYTSSGYGYLDRWCVECSEQSGREYGTPWPCPTVAAVEAALRGES